MAISANSESAGGLDQELEERRLHGVPSARQQGDPLTSPKGLGTFHSSGEAWGSPHPVGPGPGTPNEWSAERLGQNRRALSMLPTGPIVFAGGELPADAATARRASSATW